MKRAISLAEMLSDLDIPGKYSDDEWEMEERQSVCGSTGAFFPEGVIS